VLDFAHDIGEIMSVLGYPRFSVVGVSAGAPYALACGWALAQRLVALAAVSPLGPPDGRGAIRGLRYRVPLVRSVPDAPGRRSPTCAGARSVSRETRRPRR
jgi:pimeloyl-ACP methyl ester carboxylesterase